MASYVVKGESLTAVADAIREKTGTTEPLGLVEMPEAIRNMQAGDDDGSYDQGFAAGKQAEYDAFWDVYQENGTLTKYDGAFYGGGWTDGTFKPKYDIVPIVATNMFRSCGVTNIKASLEAVGVVLDTSNCTGMVYSFNAAVTTALPKIDFTGCVTTDSAFLECRKLEDVSIVVKESNTYSSTFNACVALKNLTVEGTIGQNGFNVSSSPLLTHDSLMSIINALKDYSGSGSTYSVTLGSENLAKLTDAEKMQAVNRGWTLVGWTPPGERCGCGAELDRDGRCTAQVDQDCIGWEGPVLCSGCGALLDENGNCSEMVDSDCKGWVEE